MFPFTRNPGNETSKPTEGIESCEGLKRGCSDAGHIVFVLVGSMNLLCSKLAFFLHSGKALKMASNAAREHFRGAELIAPSWPTSEWEREREVF